ncbi:MAG TPA: YhgE/Pip family protein [Amnibacterium sp.]|nr:YhgE/Pip family protein [Amnibacterium sp.]
MTVLTLLRSELRRLTATRLGTVAFVALMTVPLLYGGLYLWGNQDPYARLGHVPAALVVEDRGAVVDGATVHYGDDVADGLVREGRFDWQRMTSSTAASRLRTGGVDFVVTLPASFSSDLASVARSHPVRARIGLTTSDANSYLSGTIAGQAATAIRAGVAQQVGAAAAKRFLVALSTVRGRLGEAASGAASLRSGAAQAASGADSLRSGTASLSSGAASLADGLATADHGARALENGADSTASGAARAASGAGRLSSAAGDLASGLRTLRSRSAGLPSSTAALASAASDTASGASEVQQGSAALAAALARVDTGSAATAGSLRARLAADGLSPARIADALAVLEPGAAAVHDAASRAGGLAEGAARVAGGASRVATGSTELASGASALSGGIAGAESGAAKVADGAAALRAGTEALSSGATSVASGARALSAGIGGADHGARTLANGAASAASGARDLAAGTTALESGAARLHDALASGVAAIPATTPAARSAEASAIGDPVAVATTKATSAGSYGAGLAPFFLSLSAWIGSYALFLILRPLSRRALTAVRAPLRIALAGWLTPALLGVAQMVGLYLIVAGPLGFAIASPPATIGVLALTAATFAAILLLLNAALGSVGQFLGLILMLVQLVTAGGTFPWQTLPAPLAAIHHALPMSYAVDALRQAMYGGDPALAWGDAGVLAIWLVASVALTAAVAARMTRRRALRDLQPSLLGG